MSQYWDTSGIIRAWLQGWEPPQGITRGHTIAEFLWVLTGPGVMKEKEGQLVKHIITPRDAAAEAKRMFARMKFQELTGEQVLAGGEALAKKGNIVGRAVHDFMHVTAAEKAGAKSIVTLNLNEFSRMTKLRLETPQPT